MIGEYEGERMVSTVQGESVRGIPRMTLTWIFLKIGVLGFGETGGLVALIEREFIDQRGALTHEDVTEALTYTKLLPGSTVVQIVAYLGYLMGGWATSALVTAAFVFPAALAMAILAAGYVAVTTLPNLQPAITGLTAAVLGMLLASAYRLGMKNITSLAALGIADAAFVIGGFLSVSAALIIALAGVIGIPLFSRAKGGAK
jgi:chromate transporter